MRESEHKEENQIEIYSIFELHCLPFELGESENKSETVL